MNQIRMSQFELWVLAKKINASHLYQFCLFDIKIFEDLKMLKDKTQVQQTYQTLLDKGYIDNNNTIISNDIKRLKSITDKYYVELIGTIPEEEKVFTVKNASFSEEGAIIATLNSENGNIVFDFYDANDINLAWYEMLKIPQNFSPDNQKFNMAIKFEHFEKLTAYYDEQNEKKFNKLCKKYSKDSFRVKEFCNKLSECSDSIVYTINYRKLLAKPCLFIVNIHENGYYTELHNYNKKNAILICDNYYNIIKTIGSGKFSK